MGRYKCCVDNCESSSGSDIKFFKFPLYNPKKLKKWLISMNREDWTPSRFSVLCINHFEEQHIDRTGKCITLREEAVPTIFSPTDIIAQSRTQVQTLNEESVASSKTKKGKPRGRPPKNREQVSVTTVAPETASEQAEDAGPEEDNTADGPETAQKWCIIVDEELMKIDSFPHFFHGNYCVSQDIQWAPDDNRSAEAKDPTSLIEASELRNNLPKSRVSGPWQWLGLDVRGPLPETSSGHKYILSVTDYYSKWVEAWPMESLLLENLVEHIVEIVNHFGFPLRILSRLPLHAVNEMNKQLKTQLNVGVPLVVHHHQTGSVDLTTQRRIDWTVKELVEEQPSDWDIYLPAKVFSLCFKEHSATKERPFTLLCCSGTEPVQSPRGLELDDDVLKECDFVVR